jgi:hypothetical protein
MSPKIHRFLLMFSALMTLFAASDASALVLGEIRSSSRLGELLHAEIEIEEDAADRFDASCVKLYRPAQASADLPWITEARLSFRRENGKGKLYISSDHPLREPVVQIGVQSTCAGGRVWREYVFLASPAGASNDLSHSPVLPLVRPATAPVLSTRKIDRVVSPGDDRAERKTGVNEPALRLTAWDAADSVSQPRSSASGVIVMESGLPLRVSAEMGAMEPSTEPVRDLLRLEYRLLTALHEQADSQLAPATNALPLAPTPVVPLPTGEKTEPVAIPPAVTDSAVPRVIPKLGPQTQAAETADDSGGVFVYAGIGAVLLLLSVVVIRRRSGEEVAESLSPMHAPTIMVEHPLFMQSPAVQPAAQALAVDAIEEEALADTPSRPLAAPPEVPPPESLGMTPVMELAEIMLSFGRVDGAAQTLQEYLEVNPKAALQPWMRLLDIYRANGMRADFEAVATNLNHNFNVEVVHWDDAAPGERVEMSLELMPHVRDQIDALWGKPECFDYLQQLLRDNRDGGRTGFTLPVVKEILLLIDLMVAEKAATNN